MAKLTGVNEIEMIVQESQNLNTLCYRGSALLAHLALISQPDIYDQVTNPEGLQRDLSTKHASDAYEYAHSEGKSHSANRPHAYAEIVLNVRNKKILEMEELPNIQGGPKQYRLRFHIDKMQDQKVHVSRVDGNHRVFYAAGDDRRDPLLVSAPFQLHVGLTREEERQLFVDINSNQKGLNTSHLAVMQSKLTPEELEIKDHLDRWITNKLSTDPESPWHGQIHLGGSKKGTRNQGLTRLVNFVSLQTGTQKLLAKSQYIYDLTDPMAQYLVIRNYWQAVKTSFSEEWADTKNYLLLKNIGVTSLSILGGTIIDRCLPRGTIGVRDMVFYLEQAKASFDWRSDAVGEHSVTGMTGNQAARIIAGAMAAELTDTTGDLIIKKVQQQLLEHASTS